MRTIAVVLVLLSPQLFAETPVTVTPRTATNKKKRASEPAPTPVIMSASRTEQCRVSFKMPVGWRVERRAEPTPPSTCSLGLLPPDYAEFVSKSEVDRERYPITLELAESEFERLARSAGFSHHDGEWKVGGRAGAQSGTSRVNGPGWHGFLGEPSIGMHFKAGGYAGLGDTQRALLSGPGGRGAVFDVTVIEYMEVFARILESFRFDEPSRR